MAHSYVATISWDAEAGVWYVSDTDFPGLVAEAGTQQELMRKVRQLVPDLYQANRHLLEHADCETIRLEITSTRIEEIVLAG